MNGFPCRVWTKGSGPKLGWLAGFGGLPRWIPFLDELAKTRTVIAPSLPGFGWSDKPDQSGWGVARIAAAWEALMVRLGYDRFGAQGGDWGSMVTTALGVQHRHRVHLDVLVDHELHAREADAVVRQKRERKSLLGIGEVQHDLRAWPLKRLEARLLHVKGEFAVIDKAGVALRAGNRDDLAFLERFGAMLGPNDGWNAELTADDGGMAGAPAAVGDDGAGALHHRLPVGVGHVGDQHVAALHAFHLGRAAHQTRGAGADLLADGAALGQDRRLRAVALELVALLDAAACALRVPLAHQGPGRVMPHGDRVYFLPWHGESVLELTAGAKDVIAEQGWDPQYGARPLKRAIVKAVQDPLAEELLTGGYANGSTVRCDVEGEGFKFVGHLGASLSVVG